MMGILRSCFKHWICLAYSQTIDFDFDFNYPPGRSHHSSHILPASITTMASFQDLPAELLYRIAHFIGEANHTKRDTRKYLTSPVITQWKVVDADFWRLTLARYANLRNLALTCHMTRSPAQEALFRRVAVDNSIRERSYRPTSLHRFLLTILKHRHLADRVHELHLDIDPCLESHVVSVRDHEPGSGNVCPLCVHDGMCHFGHLVNLCRNLLRYWLKRHKAMEDSDTRSLFRFYRLLIDNMNHGFEIWLSIVGILLNLLPLVQNERSKRTGALSINTHGDCHEAQELLFGDNTCLVPPLFVGFRYLTSLKTSFVPIWSVLQTPTLRKLHIVLAELEHLQYRHNEGPCDYEIPENAECDHITEMAIDIRAEVIESYFGGPPSYRGHGADRIIQKLQQSLPNLQNLEIRIVWKMDISPELPNNRDWDTSGMEYSSLMRLLEVPSLTRLCIDASDVDWLNFRPLLAKDSPTASPADLVRQSIWPFPMSWNKAGKTGDFANMKRLIVPQELLFNSVHDQDERRVFCTIGIPASIESIEIIDSSVCLNEWAAHVLDNPQEYPHLKRVVLWCDKLPNVLGRDYAFEEDHIIGVNQNLGKGKVNYDDWAEMAYFQLSMMKPYLGRMDHVPLDDSTREDMNREWALRKQDVWGRMQSAGIEVIFKTDRQQGWREL